MLKGTCDVGWTDRKGVGFPNSGVEMPSGVCSFGLREDKGPFAGVTSFTMLKSYLWSTGVIPFECRNSVMEVSRSSRFESEKC